MYDEIRFLFDDVSKKISNQDNSTDIFNPGIPPKDKTIYVRYKESGQSNTATIKNFLSESSYKDKDHDDSNPFVQLLSDPTFSDGKMLLSPVDFAYLTDLGVYPLNRLMILRRYDEEVIVPHNLNQLPDNIKPISTVIGWITKKEEEMFNISVSERWVEETSLLHDLIAKMLKNETQTAAGGFIDLSKVASVPSWSQGLIFEFLNKMGLTGNDLNRDGTYNSADLPIGDPNVLRVSSRRDIDNQSLDSSLNIKFETSYEQKYINGVDPGSAIMDIFNNILRMGTSDMKYILNKGSLSGLMDAIVNQNTDNYLKQWESQLKELSIKFIETISNITNNVSISNFTDTFIQLGSNLLTGIIRKYRWPLRGSLALMTGLPTTPWHLTIGNPFNPVISVSNILVKDIKIGWSNDMGFNDMPTKLNISIELGFSRPLGGNEIMEIFNNGYGRKYAIYRPDNSVENTSLQSDYTNYSKSANKNPDPNIPYEYPGTTFGSVTQNR